MSSSRLKLICLGRCSLGLPACSRLFLVLQSFQLQTSIDYCAKTLGQSRLRPRLRASPLWDNNREPNVQLDAAQVHTVRRACTAQCEPCDDVFR
jgi:hypothetical protein